MKYSLMSLMIAPVLKLKNPNFIHELILQDLGYQGPAMNLEDTLKYLNDHGVPMENGTMTFRDMVKYAADAGFDGIDVMAMHFEEDGETARAALEEFGMTMSSLNVVTEFGNSNSEEMYQDCLAGVKELFDRGKAAGCKHIMLMPTNYYPAEGVTREDVFQNMVRGLKDSVAYGKELGLTVSTETLESIAVPLCSNGEMMRLHAAVPGLKYTHDTGNPVVALEDPIRTYELFKDKVSYVHFKDLDFIEEKTRIMDALGRFLNKDVPMGEGFIDLKKHQELLLRDHYDGYIAVEGLRPADDMLDGAEKALRYLRDLEG